MTNYTLYSVGFNMESPIGPPNMRGTESAFLCFLTKGAEIYGPGGKIGVNIKGEQGGGGL